MNVHAHRDSIPKPRSPIKPSPVWGGVPKTRICNPDPILSCLGSQFRILLVEGLCKGYCGHSLVLALDSDFERSTRGTVVASGSLHWTVEGFHSVSK